MIIISIMQTFEFDVPWEQIRDCALDIVVIIGIVNTITIIIISSSIIRINTIIITIIIIRDPLKKKITGLFGNFSQMADPPPSPTFGNPLFEKKCYRLFCILGP